MTDPYPAYDPYRVSGPAAPSSRGPAGLSNLLLFGMLLLHGAMLAVLVYLVWADRRDVRQAENSKVGLAVPLDRPTAVRDPKSGKLRLLSPDGSSMPFMEKTPPNKSLAENTHRGSTLKLNTAWVDGKLLYSLTIKPVSKRLLRVRDSNPNATYTLTFQTDNGVALASTPVFLHRLSPVVEEGEEGRRVVGLSQEGDVPMSLLAYARLERWSYSWNFELPPDEEKKEGNKDEKKGG
jgi:hypothetical protein